jgi:tRNA(fMet)-specific endonuclease VapC
MTPQIIDTNVLTHIQEDDDEEISRRIRTYRPGEIGLTIISVEEALTGWYTELRRHKKPAKLAAIYLKFTKAVNLLKMFRVYTYSEDAMARFQELRAGRYNIGGNDMRIAAIALEYDAVLITRNEQHFDRIPQLVVDTWKV